MNSKPSRCFSILFIGCVALATAPLLAHDPWEHSYYTYEDTSAIDAHPASENPVQAGEVFTDFAVTEETAAAATYAEDESTGLMPGEQPASAAAASTSSQEVSNQIRASLDHGWYKYDNVEGRVLSFRVPYKYQINSRVAVAASARILVQSFDDVLFPNGDADLTGWGITVGMPYSFYNKEDGKDYRWTVTPSIGYGRRISDDLMNGGEVYTPGLSSNFLYKVAPHLILNLGNSYTYHFARGIKNYGFEPKDQAILMNGLQGIMPFGRWVFCLYFIDTRFLMQSPTLDTFQTYGASVGYRISKKISLRLNYYHENADLFRADHVGLSGAWDF